LKISHANFDFEKTYTVLIPARVIDENTILDEITWSFTTEEYNSDIPAIAAGKVYAAAGKLYVDGYPSGSSVKILNVIGQVVSTQRVTSGALSVNLAPGVYLVQLQAEGQTTTYKLIIDN
jgi:hypothetical protein